MKHGLIRSAMLLAALSCTGASHADTVTLAPSADGDVQFSGVLGYFVDTINTRVTTLRSGGNNVRNAVYEFDLSVIPDDATITAVHLRLTSDAQVSNTSTSATIRVAGFAGDGVVTQDDHETLIGGDLLVIAGIGAGAASAAAGSLFDFSLGPNGVDLLQSLLASNALTLRTSTDNFATFSVASLEHATRSAVALEIEFTPVPLPGAWLLFGAATLGLTKRRRQRGAASI